MLAAATTATQATTAAHTASIAAPTANNRSNINNNMLTKKIVLYNPSIDYSAPLQQQINPDIIGAHPHAQQYQQQSNAGGSTSGASITIHNTNQVRQPQQLQQQQQQAQQQPCVSAFTPVAAARLSLAGLAAAATTAAASAQTSNQQQQQKQQLALQQQMLATLPLKLSEQCTLSNLHLNNFVNEMSPIKSGLEQPQLQQQQQLQQRSNNQVVGLLGRNGESNGLLANTSVGSSISNLLISNNLATTTATPAVSATSGSGETRDAATTSGSTANKLNVLWSQPQAALNSFISDGGCNTATSQLFGTQTSTAETISTLWGCTSSSVSSGASFTSGCSSGSGSQPSLSPTSTTSTRPEYRSSNSKELLWSVSQSSPNTSNSLRDTYYATKTGVAINIASAQAGRTGSGGGSGANAGDNNQQSTSPSASSTCSSASSTCSSGLGSSSSTGIDVGVWPNCKLQNFFAVDNCVAAAVSNDDTSQFSKISNIWDIPNPAADKTSISTADLFTDLWGTNTNDRSNVTAATAAARVPSNTNADMDLGESIDFTDASSIWRTNPQPSRAAGGAGTRALTKQLSTTVAVSNNKGFHASNSDGNHCMGAGMGVIEADGGTACMQLFSEQFLNYINIMNYAD